MSKREDTAIDIYLEKRSYYDLDGAYGEDIYTLVFNPGNKPIAVRELVLKDIESLYELLGKVIDVEKECRAISGKLVKNVTFTEE